MVERTTGVPSCARVSRRLRVARTIGRRLPPAWVGALAIAAALTMLAKTSIATPSARLVYLRNAGTESCPDEAAVRAAVSRRLGYDPFFPHAAATMFIELSREKNGHHARVKLVDEKNDVRGTREITQAGSCTGMIDTLALSISIAIDPESLTRAPGTPPPAEPAAPTEEAEPAAPEAPEEPETPAPKKETAPPAPDVAPSARWELWLAPALWVGSGPAVAFGAELGARRRWTNLSLGLSARGDLPASRSVEGREASLGFLAASAAACGHVNVFAACALATLGRVSASSTGADGREDSTSRFLVGVSVGADVPVGDRFFVLGRAIGNVALGDQTIVVRGVPAYDLPQLSVGFELGAGVRF